MKRYLSPKDKERYADYLTINAKYYHLAKKIDAAEYTKNLEVLHQAIDECQKAINLSTDPLELSTLYYFKSNGLRGLKEKNSWNWRTAIEGQILLAMRNSIRYSLIVSHKIPKAELARRYTNLANATDFAGLFIEAGELYDRALYFQEDKGVALLNKGISLISYGNYVCNEDTAQIFMREAAFWLQEAFRIGEKDLREEAIPIEQAKERYSRFLQVPQPVQFKNIEEKFSIETEELKYRKWVAGNKLFLNPLNDLCSEPIKLCVVEDCLMAPSFIFDDRSKRKYLPLWINQIKQEFIAARTLCFEGFSAPREHYSDHLTFLEAHPLLPGRIYSFNLEKIKWAFRSAYSLFDKIAVILTDMYAIEHTRKNIYFRSFWYQNGDLNQPLKPFFSSEPKTKNFNQHNLALRALFSIANDFSSKTEEWKDSLDEEMKDITAMRDHLEHNGLEVIETGESNLKERIITLQDLIDKTLYLLKKCRNAIMYLIFAINEESRKETEKDKHLRLPIHGLPYFVPEGLDFSPGKDSSSKNK